MEAHDRLVHKRNVTGHPVKAERSFHVLRLKRTELKEQPFSVYRVSINLSTRRTNWLLRPGFVFWEYTERKFLKYSDIKRFHVRHKFVPLIGSRATHVRNTVPPIRIPGFNAIAPSRTARVDETKPRESRVCFLVMSKESHSSGITIYSYCFALVALIHKVMNTGRSCQIMYRLCRLAHRVNSKRAKFPDIISSKYTHSTTHRTYVR